MHYEQYKQRYQSRACYARGPFIQKKIQKRYRDGTQMKIKEATKNEANELKY